MTAFTARVSNIALRPKAFALRRKAVFGRRVGRRGVIPAKAGIHFYCLDGGICKSCIDTTREVVYEFGLTIARGLGTQEGEHGKGNRCLLLR